MSKLLKAGLEFLNKLLCNIFVDKGAGCSNACLTRVEQEVLAMVLQRYLEVGVWEDQTRGLATQFKSNTFQVAWSNVRSGL